MDITELLEKHKIQIPVNLSPEEYKRIATNHIRVVLYLEAHPKAAEQFDKFSETGFGIGYFDILLRADKNDDIVNQAATIMEDLS